MVTTPQSSRFAAALSGCVDLTDVCVHQGSALCGLTGSDDELGKTRILQLMEEVDNYIVEPTREFDKVS